MKFMNNYIYVYYSLYNKFLVYVQKINDMNILLCMKIYKYKFIMNCLICIKNKCENNKLIN